MNRWMMFGLMFLCDFILIVSVFDLTFGYAGMLSGSSTVAFVIGLVAAFGVSFYLRARSKLLTKTQR
jgi:hypothetical protein